MRVYLFILGLPGSGKSSVARYIQGYAEDRHWVARSHYNDYVILRNMFENDSARKQFKPADGGGFDVIDLTAFDIALQKLEQQIRAYVSAPGTEEIVLIEFSRADYLRALHQFSKEFLQDPNTYFLYLDTELAICKQRIENRITDPRYEDDYPVSDYIFEKYYHQDDGQLLADILEREYQIERQQVKIIKNSSSLEVAAAEISAFVDFIISEASKRLVTAGAS
ncbi:MAG TPA: hypothetical protein VKV20_06795 [Ktedonobacteraceae bacterium]|jgi:adenylate kinase family enzyme|nr:hypothetical protein [Ktedonobacteraceae bacterium]